MEMVIWMETEMTKMETMDMMMEIKMKQILKMTQTEYIDGK